MGALTERELLSRIAAGHQDALGVLYERHVRAVYRYALVELRSREDAEDATHEVFLTFVAKAKSIVLPGDSVLPWLLVTCRNHCRNKQRAVARELAKRWSMDAAATIATSESAEEIAEFNALRRSVADAVDELTKDDRRLFELCIIGHLTYKEAAEVLGMSHGGVRNRLSRLRARLRHSIDTNQEVYPR
ncbi:RNA polymerase sigma factor [Humibacter ginsenosidimutans]|uniref:Sigma-70 family RNA polymerase sigma factor n=1 Tax=Humibacter ginsenosidimutans TaxID=2599293 RepID=A0A5B8M6A4_9MICO|nr:sigma-70 family RNA polymerase sigma factor [Humibacter ginsenosidimutans]QDZ15893.1 sigma-70 family RNA polymerase sigma factor [Humibacter ginsenosidimutans]